MGNSINEYKRGEHMKDKPNNSVIEMYSINKLTDSVLRTGVIEPGVNENDKTPSWDGELRLYRSREFAKADLVGRIPVQVKGTWVERFQKSKATFQAEVSDLRNYLNDGGVIFFLIQIKDYDDYRIYYTSLLPFDLRRILDSAGQQKTKQIKLELFPHKYRDGIVRILTDFLTNKKKQAALLPDIRSMQDLKDSKLEIDKLELSVPTVGITSSDDMFEELLNHPQYIYVKPKNIDLSFAVDKVHTEKIVMHQKTAIAVNGEVLYDHIDVVRLSGRKKQYKLGNDVTVTADGSRFNMSYQFRGTLQEQIREMKLISALMQKQPICIGGNSLSDGFSLNFHGHTLDEVLERLSALLRIDAALKTLHVQKDLNLGGLTDKEMSNLNYLVAGILDGEPVPFSLTTKTNVGKLSLGNITLLLVMKKSENGTGYLISDFFEIDDLVLTEKDTNPQSGSQISPYVLMDVNQFETIDNANLSQIMLSVRKRPYSNVYGERIILLVLELLKLYDRQKNGAILNIVIQLLDFLEEHDSSQAELYQVNRLQTEKRRRKLTKEEMQYLSSMRADGFPLQYQLAANILLESFREAEMIYEKLDEVEREIFDTYPIKNLWIR